MVKKPWKIIPRPLLETILNNHAQHHRVPQPLILHGPRGVGKTTLLLDRLLTDWNKAPHLTGYVDFAESVEGHRPSHGQLFPWGSWSTCPPPSLSDCRKSLEQCLESMAERGVRMGTITAQQVFATLSKSHGLTEALRRVLLAGGNASKSPVRNKRRASPAVLWDRAIFTTSARCDDAEIDRILGFGEKGKISMSREEASYFKEAIVALKVAKKVIEVKQGWRANAIAHMNRTGVFSRSLAHSSTDWPCLLLELLSQAAEIDHFQPKLVLNNIEVLKHATVNDEISVKGPLYHDSLIWRIIALGMNERCLPVILVTSDSYYSYEAFLEFGYKDIFISREKKITIQFLPNLFINLTLHFAFLLKLGEKCTELQPKELSEVVIDITCTSLRQNFAKEEGRVSKTFGWTPQEAKMHMVPDYFSHKEWNVIAEVLGPNPRHLSELYALKQSKYYEKITEDKASTFEDIVDAYLAYLQITVLNPAMDRALEILQKFAIDVCNGKVSKDRLRFGAPWRHPPQVDDPKLRMKWAKLQLMDFVQALINTEFGVNYRIDYSEEIFDDPAAVALLEIGLLYAQRDPPFLRPISRGIERCIVRWHVQQQMQLRFPNTIRFLCHRIFRGRYYRHLMVQPGHKY
ncbi:hypothetical protein PIB30_041222 [Stylosanthes scabra]|uniref:Uncharacterized protein n=1 Tax=Stylosanthes scabra TaxID=79078 RepID=A0ABU6RFJ4_9FABA|nr:hypothetical protein [Stylosanthes scabra]